MTNGRIDSAAYYDRNGARYIADTEAVDMSAIHARFLAHLPPRARILDAGCGSGRDSLAFQRIGHEVTATDGSAAMVRHTSALLGQPALHLRHEEIAFEGAFDGIWSNASLLHVPQADLPDVLVRLRRALVPGGVLFASFKLGEGEVHRPPRIFTHQTVTSFRALIDQLDGLTIVETWVSSDLRPGRADERWLNALCRRIGDEPSRRATTSSRP